MAKHFEEVWVDAEKASENTPTPRAELFIKIKQDIEEYAKLDNIPSMDIQSILKTKKFGELLYKLAELSHTDNVNTYAALQMEIQIATNGNGATVTQS